MQEVCATSLKFSANQHSTVSEKTWMSNHLPMAWQRQHILFKYLKTHSVGLVWSGLELEPSTLSHRDLAPLKPEFTWNKQKFTTFLEYPCSTKTLLVSLSSQLFTFYLKTEYSWFLFSWTLLTEFNNFKEEISISCCYIITREIQSELLC